MMHPARFPLTLAVAAFVIEGSSRVSHPKQPPAKPGVCAFTTIRWIGQRLADGSGHLLVPSPGSAVTLANGVRGVAYDDVPAVQRSRVGDRVMTCLVKLPTHCPPGDERGRWYTTTDLRTDESWTLPDAEHLCGGA